LGWSKTVQVAGINSRMISCAAAGPVSSNVSDSPTGTIASVEHALESMSDRLRERETDLQQYRKQGEDLTKQLDHPFEHEEKLATATKRQQEIIAALDITKNQASARIDEGTEEGSATIQEKPNTVRNARAASTGAMSV
jgi:chromosome segregation ATPase